MNSKTHLFVKKLTQKLPSIPRRSSVKVPVMPHKCHHKPPPDTVCLYNLDEFDAIYESLLDDIDLTGMCCFGFGETVRTIRIGHSYKDLIRISNPNDLFRFPDLPTDIQIMILDYLVNPYPGKKWTAYITQDRAGVQFMPNNRTPQPVKYFNEPVMWRNNNGLTTRSLLLTSHLMRDLTIRTLQGLFSGNLCPQGHKLAGLTGPQIPDECFEMLRPGELFVQRNAWIFDRVVHISVDRRWLDWILAADVMPQLKSVTLRHHFWKNISVKEAQEPNQEWRQMFLDGKIDAFVTRSGDVRDVQEPWPEYRRNLLTACSTAVSKRKDLEIYVKCLGNVLPWVSAQDYDVSLYHKEYELRIWPDTGKIR